jgi:hypothetical protein
MPQLPRARVLLPDAMAVEALDALEAKFIYEEVFRRGCYLKEGVVQIGAGDVVVDVGKLVLQQQHHTSMPHVWM